MSVRSPFLVPFQIAIYRPVSRFETEVAMREISVLQTGGPDVLQLVSATSPTPGPNEVLVEIEASGVNYVDLLQRDGRDDSQNRIARASRAWEWSVKWVSA
jgi:hypothetical protein